MVDDSTRDPRQPVTPDDAYLRAVNAQTSRAIAAATPLTSDFDGADAAVREKVAHALDARADDLIALSHDLHAHPEEGFAEHRSVAQVAALVQRCGYDAEVGLGEVDTALRAGAGESGPHVAILAEYDALPGIGHGCGHNIICSSAVGAFLSAAPVAAELGGRVSLFGTPAEEGGGGKELLAQQGLFDDVDAVVMLHPFGYDIAVHAFLGRRQVEIVFHGVAAHSSAQPFMGRNALDAVVHTYQGVSALRQHLPFSDRVHGVITDGGQRPNVVPERASVLFYLRSAEPETLRDLAERIDGIAHGAAAMTGCGIELNWDEAPAYLPIRHNEALAARWTQHQASRGRTALPRGVIPESLTGSTDLGNISYRVPAIHPMIAIEGDNLAMHTAEFAVAAGSEAGDRTVLDGAHGLAMTTVDYLADERLRAAVREEFDAAGGALDVANFFN